MIQNEKYLEDIIKIATYDFDWNLLRNTNVLITGVTGMIGTVLVDVFMYRNKFFNNNISIIGIGRNLDRARYRFNEYLNDQKFNFYCRNINKGFLDLPSSDYIFHCASNTHPVQYANNPIETVNTSIIGTNNVLDYATKFNVNRTIFLSSVEIYGENKADTDEFYEEYCGYINSNTLRAGYPEGKRVAEALCKAFEKEYSLDIVIARLCRIYGPTMIEGDSKVVSQFIHNALDNEDIKLKSEGNQYFSYMYVMDAVLGILLLLFKGKKGEAYNIADSNSNILLKDLALLIAKKINKKVVFELPDFNEKEGFSVVNKAIMSSQKINSLGFEPFYGIEEGICRTLDILKK